MSDFRVRPGSEADRQKTTLLVRFVGTTLLFFGISALVGGLGRVRQTFSQASAGLLSTLLFLVVVAIMLPAVFDLTERFATPGVNASLVDERLSLSFSVVLLLLYAANLIYTLQSPFATCLPAMHRAARPNGVSPRALAGWEPTWRGCLLDDAFAPKDGVSRRLRLSLGC